jgi:siroheme synthase-like protein
MRTFPIMLDVRGRLAVVVGGGAVGLRKVRSLLEAGASVRLVSRDSPRKPLPDGVKAVRAPYAAKHLRGAVLVFACTDDPRANARIAADARKAGALVNVADRPEDCDFFVPAVVADREVVVAIGTGGSAPALAAGLKRRIAAALPERIGEFAALLSELREELKGLVGDPVRRMEAAKTLADEDTYRRFLRGGPDAVRRKMMAMTAGL